LVNGDINYGIKCFFIGIIISFIATETNTLKWQNSNLHDIGLC